MDPETFSKIQETFGKASGLAVTVFDNFLMQLAPSSNLNPLCSRLLSLRRSKPEIAQKCLDTHYEGLKEALRTGKSNPYRCYLGLESTAIPLLSYDKPVGGISVGRVRVGEVDEKAFEILEAYGLNKEEFLAVARDLETVDAERYQNWINLLSSMAGSVVRERSQQLEEQKRARRLAFISDLSRHVGDELDTLLEFIAHAFPEACELEKCTIFFLDEDKAELVARASNAFTIPELKNFKVSIRDEKGKLVVESEPFVSPDALSDPRLIKEYVEMCRIKSLLTVPLKVREKVLGVIHFVNSETPHHFTPEEIKFINALAAEVALAIESTLLHADRERPHFRLGHRKPHAPGGRSFHARAESGWVCRLFY